MMRQESKRDLARQLYATGYSYRELAKRLEVNKSTLSGWCSDLAQSRRAAQQAARAAEREAQRQEALSRGLPDPATREIRPKRVDVRRAAPPPFEGWWMYESLRGDGVWQIQLTLMSNTKIKLNMARARYVMSVHLGRRLESHERVLHRESADDNIDNLLLTTRDNMTGHRRFLNGRVTVTERQCVICEQTFTLKPRGKKAETCSKECKYTLISGIITEQHALRRKAEESQ